MARHSKPSEKKLPPTQSHALLFKSKKKTHLKTLASTLINFNSKDEAVFARKQAIQKFKARLNLITTCSTPQPPTELFSELRLAAPTGQQAPTDTNSSFAPQFLKK